jgi:uroporphyrinogen decarboxylase
MLLDKKVEPDWEGLVRCIQRAGTPGRVYNIELFLDAEIKQAVCDRFGLADGLDPQDEFFLEQREIQIQRFLGYDYVRASLDGLGIATPSTTIADTAELAHKDGRSFKDEHHGPIMSWEEFEAFEWPDAAACETRTLEWYSENLPENMCIVGSGGFAHYCEYLSWLMGYETLCFNLFDQRDLVKAISEKLNAYYRIAIERILRFERVKIIWGSDDMGFKNGILISPDDLREFVLPGHTAMAAASHEAGRPYMLHSCGKLDAIMPDLLDDVGIDARHSFEDTIESVIDCKATHGDRIALLGGIDVDFLCRSDEAAIRRRVRETLEACQPGGGYCLGTGNSVANYIPVENFLIMLDEGRQWEG